MISLSPSQLFKYSISAIALCGAAACGGGNPETNINAVADGSLSASSQKSTALDANTPEWTFVADEGQDFAVSGSQLVRYGSGSTWLTTTVTGSGQCTNEFFGVDPLVGTVKRCEVGASSEGTWTFIANEHQTFAVAGTQTVRYGAEARWITKVVSGSGGCSNDYFGADPLVGVVKRCETSGPSAPAPAPSPSPSGPETVCAPPIGLVDTSGVAPAVGDGTPGSCTESALRAAIASQSVITFNCGPSAVTIPVSSTIVVPTDRDTVIDGNGLVTLDGRNGTRILSLVKPDYRTNRLGLTVQRMRFVNGAASGTGYVAPDPAHPQCASGYAGGSGGAIEVRDARLHVIAVEFVGNAAATPGPDVGGGAIYAAGALDVTIVGSSFVGNTGSNAGALGLLQSDARIYNSLFQNSTATGFGENYAGGDAASCPGVGHSGQGGSGGLGGAVMIDGSDNMDVVVCGSRFIENRANELGGAFFRTMNTAGRRTVLDRTLFQNNRAKHAGAAYIQNASPLEISASSFVGNVAEGIGAAQIFGSKLTIVNTTFARNRAERGVGGALMLNYPDPESLMLNVTFADNLSDGGLGFFSAAIFGDLNFPVRNTVFSNNLTNDGGAPMQCTFVPGSGSDNFQWPPTHVAGDALDTPCTNGIAFADPLLGGLGDNGGPTPTLAPAPSSPLRAAGHACPPTDQRGVQRNTSQCTAGAVE
jgi:hypothetical protein